MKRSAVRRAKAPGRGTQPRHFSAIVLVLILQTASGCEFPKFKAPCDLNHIHKYQNLGKVRSSKFPA